MAKLLLLFSAGFAGTTRGAGHCSKAMYDCVIPVNEKPGMQVTFVAPVGQVVLLPLSIAGRLWACPYPLAILVKAGKPQ